MDPIQPINPSPAPIPPLDPTLVKVRQRKEEEEEGRRRQRQRKPPLEEEQRKGQHIDLEA